MEVPKDDFDFESSNAKFNKQDLVKEAIAGTSPAESPIEEAAPETNATGSYNKSSSFFDDLSSESKDRAEVTPLAGAQVAASGAVRSRRRTSRPSDREASIMDTVVVTAVADADAAA